MRVLPAIDLMDGHVVQLVGGDPEKRAVEEPDPVATAHRWVEAGAVGLHLVDLDAALGRGENRDAVEAVLGAVEVPVQVGGGVRTTEDVDALLRSGAAAVVVGTRAVSDPQWLSEAAEAHPDRLVVALDARNGEVVADGWTKRTGRDVSAAAAALDGLRLAGILFTGVQVEGSMTGVDRGTVGRLVEATKHPVIASGGISSGADIRFLAEAGCDACVLGMALYTGRLTLTNAMHAAHEARTQW